MRFLKLGFLKLGFLERLSSRFHLSVGLASLVVTLLLAALFAGLLPDRDSALRAGRTSLAEAVGVSATALLADPEQNRLQQVLDFVVNRNSDLLSIGLRQADGTLRMQAGAGADLFKPGLDGRSTETRVRVPLLFEGAVWGHAELQFSALDGTSLMSVKRGSPTLLVLAMGAGSFIIFYFYLRRMLRHLDPSKAIPGRVRTAFDTLAEGVLVLDPEGRVVLANQAFADVVGGSSDALIGRSAHSLGWELPAGTTTDHTPWGALFSDGGARHKVLLYLQDRQGQRRSFLVNGSPVPGANGKPAGMLVSLDDITALEEKEVQLRGARDAAEAANQAKSDFLANMSHDIRTPMNAILGFAELLKRGWQQNPQDTQRHLNTILSSGRHLLTLINDILDLSKIESGRLEVERLACPVHEVVREVVDILQVRAQQTGVALALEFPAPLPALMATDAGRLRQIVTNLLGNALKFTRQGQVTVRVFLADPGQTARLCIDVSDTGIGIASDKLNAIFEPFVQAEASTTRQFGGTGLGLAISRRFARALGGDITVSSVPGQGSTFHVSLDVGVPDPEQTMLSVSALNTPPALPAATGSPLQWRFEPATVLVVDDGAENRELVRLVLESAGLSVQEAHDGKQALQQVAAHQPALVLMDVQMPVMDGYTATRLLRERGFAAPIVALTANAMKGFERDIEETGFMAYLTKPVNIDELLQTISQHLAAHQVQAAAEPAFEMLAPPGAAPDNAAQRSALLDTSPLRSRLENHPRLGRVVHTFAATLPTKLQLMDQALAAHRFAELAELAHWLKGAGGTVGFDAFFEPAKQLEQAAQNNNPHLAQTCLRDIRAFQARIHLPKPRPDELSLQSVPVLDEALS